MSLDWAAPHTSLKVTSTKREVMDHRLVTPIFLPTS